jgi:hypothetical protein
MKGDFSRLTFDPTRHFSRVLMQQGRVTLDADHNEQSDITLHMLRTLAQDLFGQYGGPAEGRGFGLYFASSGSGPSHLMIGAGHYYVDGILCENEQERDYADQPDYMPAAPGSGPVADSLLNWLTSPTAGPAFWVYLDVWERHITWVEDDRIREVALGGPDTCTRTKVVWQVKAVSLAALIDTLTKKKSTVDAIVPQTPDTEALSKKLANDIALLQNSQQQDACAAPLDALDPIGAAWMAARLDPGLQIQDPCIISPDAKYRGAENQLYRVEIHQGGSGGDELAPTFKWSRDNGSILAPWLDTDGNDLIVTSGRGFEVGSWVEISDDSCDWDAIPGTLVKLANVAGDRLSVDPASIPASGLPARNADLHPKVRQWDQRENDVTTLVDGAIPIVEGTTANWGITLEDGIQIQFAQGGQYRTGDYWLIPARVATGDIDWPTDTDSSGNVTPVPLLPSGIEHHYAPLAVIAGLPTTAGGGVVPTVQSSCRICSSPLTSKPCTLTQQPPTVTPPGAAPIDSTVVKPKNTILGKVSQPKGRFPSKRKPG